MAKPVLRVLPNPYAAELDHEGRCHGHTQYEPNVVSGDASLRWVGCRVIATKTREANPSIQLADDHDHAWEYDVAPVLVPVSAYYLRALQHHDLLPADVDTHAHAFGNREGFIDPVKRIAQFARERGARPEPESVWGPLLDRHDDLAADERDPQPKLLSAHVEE